MKRAFLLGLTGSIGMGKSTTARLFAEAGIPVWDADAAVHRLYAAGGAGSEAISGLVPTAVRSEGVDRDALRRAISRDPTLLERIEALVHPLLAGDRRQFIATNPAALIVLDIPLLFETGAERGMDAVLVVTASAEAQRSRVLARAGMTEADLDLMLKRQMPDSEKRRRADHVIDTSHGVEAARTAVLALISRLTGDMSNA